MAARWRPIACAVALAGLVSGACSREPNIEERPVYVYAPRACPLSQDRAYGVLYAGGDFQPTPESAPIARLFLNEVGRAMDAFPSQTRSIVVDVSQSGTADPSADALRWWGYAEVPARGPVNVLVWPVRERCDLTRNVDIRIGSTLGVFGRHVMIVGGKRPDDSNPLTYVGDLSTGVLEGLDLGLLVKRSRPTVTTFGTDAETGLSSALVAGGEDQTGEPLDSAEIYAPKAGAPGDIGDFDRQNVRLAAARKNHGAVVLASGATALVGGTGRNGTPLRSIEIVDPASRQSRSDGLRQLAIARANPTVLRLANGEIMVAGGTDASGSAVKAIEWLSPDLRPDSAQRTTKRPIDLVTGRERAIVALPAGGALAVVAPEDPTQRSFQTVYVISAEGSIEAGVPVDPLELEHVHMLDGAGGAPVLWTGKRWLRWQPWFGAFEPVAEAPTTGPDTDVMTSGDSGLGLWLAERRIANELAGMYVAGWRFAARPRFDAVNGALLSGATLGLVPDRIPGVGRAIHYDEGAGLSLGSGAAAFLPDLTFADFRVEVDVVGAAPEIVLRPGVGAELAVGGAECAFALAARQTLVVDRKGAEVRVTVDGREPRACTTTIDATARVALGLRGAGGTGTTGARNLRVTRR